MSLTNEERRKIDEMYEMIHAMHASHQRIAENVGRHDKTLYGNGQPGLCTEFKKVQVIQAECPARAFRRPANILSTIAIAIAAIAMLLQAWSAWKSAPEKTTQIRKNENRISLEKRIPRGTSVRNILGIGRGMAMAFIPGIGLETMRVLFWEELRPAFWDALRKRYWVCSVAIPFQNRSGGSQIA